MLDYASTTAIGLSPSANTRRWQTCPGSPPGKCLSGGLIVQTRPHEFIVGCAALIVTFEADSIGRRASRHPQRRTRPAGRPGVASPSAVIRRPAASRPSSPHSPRVNSACRACGTIAITSLAPPRSVSTTRLHARRQSASSTRAAPCIYETAPTANIRRVLAIS